MKVSLRFFNYFVIRHALVVLCGILSIQSGFSNNVEKETRMLINLLDYIGKDYSGAVAHGEIINQYEFDEMQEFSENTIIYFQRLCRETVIADSLEITREINMLQQLIREKQPAAEIAKTANSIKQQILQLELVAISPDKWPDITVGRQLFLDGCATCHGEKGDGNGSGAKGLDPAPSDFRDTSLINNLTPFQSYNTIRLGLPGTAMRAFAELSDAEVWATAFYINSLNYQGAVKRKPQFNIPLSDVATLSDNELKKKYGSAKGFDIAAIRLHKPEQDIIKPLDIAKRYLDEALAAYTSGNKRMAAEKALKGYLEGVEPVENRIMASDGRLVGKLEEKMIAVRTSIKKEEPTEAVREAIADAKTELANAKNLLNSQQHSIGFTAFMSASILIREGLEAFLIIIAILGILHSLNAARAIRWVHGGWMVAVLTGVISWFFADRLIGWNAQNRELTEGGIALFAVVVLLYIGFWLHNKTEIGKWKQFVEEKIKLLVKKDNMRGLAFFSFLVVFREAFESVIFLSSLKIEAGQENEVGIWLGVGMAGIAVFLLSWAILKVFDKIPLRKVFLYSSVIVVVLAVILTGEGIHAIQESGYLPVHPFPANIRITFLGIYPTYESWSGQLLIMGIITVLWVLSRRQVKKTRKYL